MGELPVAPVNPSQLLAPILPALPAAAASTSPATGLLPLLSPILRQRVQLLSDASTEPWLRLLCYDVSKASRLGAAVSSGLLEPHPVSGEVEVDWEYDVETRYKRIDQETLQAFVVMAPLQLAFLLVWCSNDEAGGGDGWRIGEVTVPEESSPFSQFGGSDTVAAAEQKFKQGKISRKPTPKAHGLLTPRISNGQEEEDDDGYWAQYDATPGRTPSHSSKPSPAPGAQARRAKDSEYDEYFSRYDEVQPAMDNHDPDEEMETSPVAPPLGIGQSRHTDRQLPSQQDAPDVPNTTQTAREPDASESQDREDADQAPRVAGLMHHPRPDSSNSSRGSNMVHKLEETAGRQEQNEFGVKQHVSRSIRSLFMLSQASGIDREEFEQLVRTELDLLSMMEEGS